MTYATPHADETELYAQARQLTVHDDIHGGYLPVIIGYWTNRGDTRCLDHLLDLGADPTAIDCGNSAAEGDRCDWPGCGTSILTAALHRRDQGGLFPTTCAAEPGRMLPLA